MWRLAPLLLLAACGPVSREDAEASCFRRAELAVRPQGSVSVGLGSGGYSYTGVGITTSSDFLMRRDPEQVYRDCVIRNSGEAPLRPLSERPDWRG